MEDLYYFYVLANYQNVSNFCTYLLENIKKIAKTSQLEDQIPYDVYCVYNQGIEKHRSYILHYFQFELI